MYKYIDIHLVLLWWILLGFARVFLEPRFKKYLSLLLKRYINKSPLWDLWWESPHLWSRVCKYAHLMVSYACFFIDIPLLVWPAIQMGFQISPAFFNIFFSGINGGLFTTSFEWSFNPSSPCSSNLSSHL